MKATVAILVLLFAAALSVRLIELAARPMHADESVQTRRFRQLWWEGGYVYNPHEFHGPTLSYATLPSVWITRPADYADTTVDTYRVVPAVFGAAMVLLLLLLADGLGRRATVLSALLMVLSPALVYYSRDYIHEMLLACFMLAAIGCGWRYARSGRLAWSLAAGVSVGLMQATKETAAVAYLAAAVAAAAVFAFGYFAHRKQTESPITPEDLADQPPRSPRRLARHLAAGCLAAVVTAALLYSSMLRNPQGLVDAVRSYTIWLGRAGGESVHVQPWYFYLHRLLAWHLADGPWWSEAIVVGLAAVGAFAALMPQPRWVAAAGAHPALVRWLAVFTVALLFLYSAIPYKTPWCAVQFLLGMVLLAGVGAVLLVRWVPTLPGKGAVALLLAAAAAQLGWQSARANFRMPADPRNPYAYAQTQPDVLRLAGEVDRLAAASPLGRDVRVQVIWTDHYYWPLPWYLRRYNHVHYWTHLPEQLDAPILISLPAFDEAMTERLDATHLMVGYYGVRPGVLAMLWVRMDLWEAHLKRLGRL